MKTILILKDGINYDLTTDIVQIDLSIGDSLDDYWSFISVITKTDDRLSKKNIRLSDIQQLIISDKD